MKLLKNLNLKNKYCVILPINFSNSLTPTQQKLIGKLHYKKIGISDAIYVVNINGYIGESCKNEIEYAKAKNKEILYHEKI